MKVKMFATKTIEKLESLVNEFLAEHTPQVMEIKFSSDANSYCAMIVYKS